MDEMLFPAKPKAKPASTEPDLFKQAPATTRSSNEEFERLAEEFYQDTGFFAPGKDPAALGGSFDERQALHLLWRQWNALRSLRGQVAEQGKWNAELQRENDEMRGVIETYGRVLTHREEDRAVATVKWEVHELVLQAASTPSELFGVAFRDAMKQLAAHRLAAVQRRLNAHA